MDIRYSPEAEAYRTKVRAFLDEHLPSDWKGIGALDEAEREAFSENWKKTLHENGFFAVNWPKAYGGSDLSFLERVILNEETSRVGATLVDVGLDIGIGLLGSTLLGLGTEAQKAYFLPKILSGEHRWCQGFSEPNSGSDLAGLGTKAELDGDEWVINGQKIWTSEAHRANWIFVLARTAPDEAKHKGITFLLVPMDQPGIEVREVTNINGSHDFNEVFFTDARAPKENVVGTVHDGWNVTSYLLGFERGVNVTTIAMLYRSEIDRLLDVAKMLGRSTDPVIRQRLAHAYIRVELMRYVGLRTLTALVNGKETGPEGSIFKLMWSEHHVAVTELALDIIGADSMAPSGRIPANFFIDLHGAPYSPLSWVWTFLAARSDTIRGGTSEIQRGIIGDRVLGLPRDPRADTGPWSKIPR